MVDAVVDFFEEFGLIGMFIHSFVDAIFFPIPAFFLQVSLSIIHPSQALWLATVGYIACLLGTPVGYLIGRLLGDKVMHKVLKGKSIHAASNMFKRNGEAAILIGSFTPIPFKIFTILAGCFKFSIWKLIGYAALGRAVKFYAVGVIFYYFGRSSENFVTSYLSIIFGIIAVILFLVYYIRRKIRKKQHQTIKGETEITS